MYHGQTASEPDTAGKLFMALNIERAEKDLRRRRHGTSPATPRPPSSARWASAWAGQLALFAGVHQPNVGAVVDFYGIHPNVKPDYAKLTGPVLGLFAEKDGFVTPQTAREVEAAIKKAGKTVEIHIYPGVDHALLQRRAGRRLQQGRRRRRLAPHPRPLQEAPEVVPRRTREQ